MNLIRLYGRMADKHPFTTATITGGTVTFFSDLSCQKLENIKKENKMYDLKRTLKMISLSMMTSPQVFMWYRFLANKLKLSGLKAVIADQLIFTPYDITFMISYYTLINNEDIIYWKKNLMKKFPEMYSTNICFWGAVLCINFTYIPLNFRLLFGSGMNFFFTIYTSYRLNN